LALSQDYLFDRDARSFLAVEVIGIRVEAPREAQIFIVFNIAELLGKIPKAFCREWGPSLAKGSGRLQRLPLPGVYMQSLEKGAGRQRMRPLFQIVCLVTMLLNG